jgi:hypothetical protein
LHSLQRGLAPITDMQEDGIRIMLYQEVLDYMSLL